ncbi:AAA family ATPase [Shivajiella indica]|uniref:ATP-binding protein n=1 Tax=Shivajiella indica TaxID=872115 RepID=A0ABW5BA27_9BACT
MKSETPFPTTGYTGPDNFCDRKRETLKIRQFLQGGQSVTLVSIRRMGKTALIRHIEFELGKTWLTIYLDIFKTSNFNELLNELATAILQAVEQNSSLGKKVWGFMKTIRPTIQFNELSGLSAVSFDVQPEIAKNNIRVIFEMLESQKVPVLISIDEFQQITQYPEKHVDAWIRSVIQELKNVVFIFSGSQHHVMTELFTHPNLPFFSSTSFMKLDKIPKEEYADFIKQKFEHAKWKVDMEGIEELLDWTDLHTYYVQLICNRMYHAGYKKNIPLAWKVEALKAMEEMQHTFFNIRNLLTKGQWRLLAAIAKEEKVFFPTAGDFIKKYDLTSSAAVIRALEALVEKEIIYYDYNQNGEKFYKLVDLLMMRWFQNFAY